MQGNYVEAECVNIDPANKVITCQYNKPFKGHDQAFTGRSFEIPYDVLVIAVSTLFNAQHIMSLHELNIFCFSKQQSTADAKPSMHPSSCCSMHMKLHVGVFYYAPFAHSIACTGVILLQDARDVLSIICGHVQSAMINISYTTDILCWPGRFPRSHASSDSCYMLSQDVISMIWYLSCCAYAEDHLLPHIQDYLLPYVQDHL